MLNVRTGTMVGIMLFLLAATACNLSASEAVVPDEPPAGEIRDDPSLEPIEALRQIREFEANAPEPVPEPESQAEMPAPDFPWGKPPDDDHTSYQAKIPQVAGWADYLGPVQSGNMFAVHNGVLYQKMNLSIIARELESGTILWEKKFQGDWHLKSLNIGQHVYTYLRGELVALDLQTGEEAWRRDDYYNRAIGNGVVWVNENFWVNPSNMPSKHSITALDETNGSVLASFAFAEARDGFITQTGKLPVFAFKVANDIVVCQPDGSTEAITSLRPEHNCVMSAAGDTLVVVEYPNENFIHRRGLTYPRLPEFELSHSIPQNPNRPSPDVFITAVDLRTMETRWRKPFLIRNDYPRVNGLLLCDGALAFAYGRHVIVLDLTDGALVFHGAGDGERALAELLHLDSSLLYYSFEDSGQPVPTLVADLSSGAVSEVFQAPEYYFRMQGKADGWLLFTTGDPYSGNYGRSFDQSLVAVKTGWGGLPLSGGMQILNSATSHQLLCERLLASPNPVGDAELMTDTVAAGSSIISRLMPQLSADDRPQLDAMAAVAAYADSAESKRWWGNTSDKVFSNELLATGGTGMSGHLGRWLNDPELEPIHQSLATILAIFGTPADARILKRYYQNSAIKQHVQPAPPFNVKTTFKTSGDYAQAIRKVGQYADFEDEGGTQFRVSSLGGLISGRYLYLLEKLSGYNQYSEVWPLGIKDHFFNSGHWTGPFGPEPEGKLTAGFEDGQIAITHHMPIVGEETYGEGERAHTMPVIVDSEILTTRFTLDGIKQDSDSDGLTDLAEKLLLTNPQRVDTDGDGLPDGVDPCPNVNPATMGVKERGMARALEFYFGMYYSRWWPGYGEQYQPWQARYMLFTSCGPVAYCGDEAVFGISVTGDKQREEFTELLGLFPSHHRFTASWSELPAGFWEMSSSAQHEALSAAGAFVLSMSEVHQATAVVVTIGFENSCVSISLAEINGEYYPLESFSSWTE